MQAWYFNHRITHYSHNNGNHGLRRSTFQPVSSDARRHRNRSCSLKAPSAQNSISTGLSLMPPQNGGRLGVTPWTAVIRATSAMSLPREASGSDWSDAHAPSLLCNDREA